MPPIAGQLGDNGQGVNRMLGAMCRPRAEEGVVGQDRVYLGSVEGHQPTSMGRHTLALDGTLYNRREVEMKYGVAGETDARLVLHAIVHQGGGRRALQRVIREIDGDFSLAYHDGQQLFLARDTVGTRPLFYTTNPFAFASERKALWALDKKQVKRVPEGTIGHVTEDGVEFEEVLSVTGGPRITSEREAVERLEEAFKRAVLERRDGAAVAFSGGVDSSLVAYYADTTLYAVGLEGSHDLKQARHAAVEMGMELWTREVGMRDVEDCLPRVIGAVETTNPLQVSIALPMYLTAEAIAEDGYRAMLTGQGADELFGGYKRYEDMDPEEQARAVGEDVRGTGRQNIDRDYMATGVWGVDLRSPYLAREVIRVGLSLAPNLRVKPNGAGKAYIRKYVLRLLADRVLPREIAWKGKKAMQYGTGVSSAIDKLARQSGFKRSEGQHMQKYLESIKDEDEETQL